MALDNSALQKFAMLDPTLRTVASVTGLSASTLCRARALRIDILGPELVEHYRGRRIGRRPRADAKILVSPVETIDALRRLRAASATPAQKIIA